MQNHRGIRLVFCLGLAASAAATARAEERRFMPIATSAEHHVSVVGAVPVVSANAHGFGGGASVLPLTSRKARLIVSVRNLGQAPLRFDVGQVGVSADGAPLEIETADAAAAKEQSANRTDRCLNVSQSDYAACMVTASQPDPTRGAAKGAVASAVEIAPSQTLPMQYVVALPKRSRSAPLSLIVTLRVGEERLAFTFREVE